MRWSHAQEALNKMTFTEGTKIQDHIELLHSRRAVLNNLSMSVMNDETWRGVIICSIPPMLKWLPVIPFLYAMTLSANIISTLFTHRMIIGRGIPTKVTTNVSPLNTVLAARTTKSCMNPNCKAKKRSTHMTANCYWPGGGKEGQTKLQPEEPGKCHHDQLNSYHLYYPTTNRALRTLGAGTNLHFWTIWDLG